MRKWNSLAVAGIVVLLILGYGVPSVVMAIEDHGRKLELQSFEIENIELNFQNVDMAEEMGVFPDMILNNIVVEAEDASIGIRLDRQQSEQENQQENLSGNIQEYTNILRIENSINEFLEVLHPEHEIPFKDFKAVYYVMMVSREDERMYPIWECYGADAEDREYCFWLDDLSGKVLAFKIPYEVIGGSDEAFFEATERLANYYGFNILDLGKSISNAYKTESWQNVLLLFDEAGNTKMCLNLFKVGENFLFNLYPGSVTIYDEAYSE